MAVPGVVGVAAGLSRRTEGEKVIIVYATEDVSLPPHLDGYPVQVVRTEGFKPMP